MLKIILIRHFATKGNLEKRYIGVTDEHLCEEGKRKRSEFVYPITDAVFASPLRRCLETAEMIYKEAKPVIYEGLKECDFGDFENKNYIEMSKDVNYQAWMNSGGSIPFPHGENPKNFKIRCVLAFEQIVRESIQSEYTSIALVVHGGTIMSIMEAYSSPSKDYYHWQVENGSGYVADYDEKEGRLRNPCIIPLSR